MAAAVALGRARADDASDPSGPSAFATAAADLSDAEWSWLRQNRHRANIRIAIVSGEIDPAEDEDEPLEAVPISYVVEAERLGAAAARCDPWPARYIRTCCSIADRAILAAGLLCDNDVGSAFLSAFRQVKDQEAARLAAYAQSRRHDDRQKAERVGAALFRTVPLRYREDATGAVLAALNLRVVAVGRDKS